MRKFEKISFSQFSHDISDDKNLYDEYNLPKRGTLKSAGYDFYAINDFVIHPGEVLKVPTGVKVIMNDDEAFMLYVRSSMGFKYNVRMTNQVGVIDADYYNNSDNEGHMWFSLQNHGDKDFVVKKGQAFGQGVFSKFLITDDDIVTDVRNSGIGSTTKEG
ncbi:MAG: deoxyuridine 5'-triphosphate nucleotidohydrolase [Bacilli bacterium]